MLGRMSWDMNLHVNISYIGLNAGNIKILVGDFPYGVYEF